MQLKRKKTGTSFKLVPVVIKTILVAT